MMKKAVPADTDGAPILDRPEASGFTGKWWPLAALAIVSLLLVRACIDAAAAVQRPATELPTTPRANTPG